MSFVEYTIAWIAYIIAAILLIGLLKYTIRNWQYRFIKNMLNLIFAMVILVPCPTDSTYDLLTPAIIVIGLYFIGMVDPNLFTLAIVIALFATLFAFICAIIASLLGRKNKTRFT